ncbi:MAG: EF-P beta-lysylation protein EpmB [Verrucomicrobia bacterium RIFCSPHIGHO2_12_FULL_41_10]|nr:MAG: EF-P beta-lysylation protein EpmB [Verrucomicrobia bacterium RIFCSPHIGHO2_12_FULL_41_10]
MQTLRKPINCSTWQDAMKNSITDPGELFDLLQLDTAHLPKAYEASKTFKLRVPRGFVNKMQKGNWDDPLLIQILPVEKELQVTPHFHKDPLQEVYFNPIPGLLHKYHGRVLLTVVGACGVNCRYCFRRHFPYEVNPVSKKTREQIVDYLKKDTSIQEVIYSGGDPLVADDDYLKELTQTLFSLPHLKRLRIHTRMPIVLPERINEAFIKWFADSKRQNILVLHCNHPNELDSTIEVNMKRLKEAGVAVLNQSVLLRGVNDDVDTQVALSEALFAHHIMPYYLHLLDQVEGAAHFDLPLEKINAIYQGMQERLPGFLVPKLAQEVPGAKHKVLV